MPPRVLRSHESSHFGAYGCGKLETGDREIEGTWKIEDRSNPTGFVRNGQRSRKAYKAPETPRNNSGKGQLSDAARNCPVSASRAK